MVRDRARQVPGHRLLGLPITVTRGTNGNEAHARRAATFGAFEPRAVPGQLRRLGGGHRGTPTPPPPASQDTPHDLEWTTTGCRRIFVAHHSDLDPSLT